MAYNALEEAVVNTVLNKKYKGDVSVEIRIYLDQIQIINFLGPDHYIDMEKFAAGVFFMGNAAIEKGYGDDIHAWAICFRLGIFGYLYVIAQPDKILQSQNQQIIDLMRGDKIEQISFRKYRNECCRCI